MSNRRVIISDLGGPEVVRVVEEPDLPQPQNGEARVRVEASSAAFTDTLIRKGIYPYIRKQPPFTLGYDLVGTVDALGHGVAGLKVGQRVADLTQIGGNAEYVVRPAESLVPVPPSVDVAEAESMILSYMTAYQMLKRVARVEAGNKILVHGGSGAVGNALLVLGRTVKLEMVATASARNLDLLREDGAIQAVDYRVPDYARRLRHAAGNGFDAAFDGVGLKSFGSSFRLLKGSGGVLVTYGAVAPARGVRRRSALVGLAGPAMFFAGSVAASARNALPGQRSERSYEINALRRERPDWFVEDLTELFGMLAAGKIEPKITARVPLEDAAHAHEMIDAGEVRGRLVLVTNGRSHDHV